MAVLKPAKLDPEAWPLSERQRAILRYIRDRALEGRPAIIRDMQEAFGIGSPNGVVFHLRTLERKGYVTHAPNRSGGVRLAGARVRLEYLDTPAGVRLREALEGEG